MTEKNQGITYRETKRFTRLMMVELDMLEIRRLKDRLPELQGELVTREILRGEGERSVSLFWRLFDDTRKKQLVKEETGEVVDEKFMEDHEQQRKFSFVEPGDRTGELEETGEGEGLTETDEKARQVYTDDAGQFSAPRITAAVTFEPLPEPLGACEICQGYGTISGELYGEPCLVPCTCEAGEKVAAINSTAEQIAAEAPEVDPCVECDADKVKEIGGDCKGCPDYPENRGKPGLPTEEKPISINDEIEGVEESLPFSVDPPAVRRGISAEEEPDAPMCPGVRACPDYLAFREKNGTPDFSAATEVGVPCYSCGSLRPAGCTGCVLRPACNETPDVAGDCRETARAKIEEVIVIEPPAGAPPVAVAEVLEPSEGDSGDPAPVEQSQAANLEPSELQKKCPHPKPFRKIIPGRGEVCGVCDLVTEPEAPKPGSLPVVDDEDYPDPPKPKPKPEECDHPKERQHLAGDSVMCGACGGVVRSIAPEKPKGGKKK